MPVTITFSEINKGWTSFYDLYPDALCSLNNRLFSIKDGQLYLHNDKDSATRNNFYGSQFNSRIVTIFNEAAGDDKIFKNLVQEGTHPWSANLKTNYTESTLSVNDFTQKESKYFAHLRKNEDETDLNGGSAQGIGVILSSSSLNIVFNSVPETVTELETLYQLNGNTPEKIGVITAINNNQITVDAIDTIPVNGYFCYSKRNSRIEGAEIRGYYMEVDMVNEDTEEVELFAVSTNAVKSYV
jgi:hypothetical protein